jgi:hypothetical protein
MQGDDRRGNNHPGEQLSEEKWAQLLIYLFFCSLVLFLQAGTVLNFCLSVLSFCLSMSFNSEFLSFNLFMNQSLIVYQYQSFFFLFRFIFNRISVIWNELAQARPQPRVATAESGRNGARDAPSTADTNRNEMM